MRREAPPLDPRRWPAAPWRLVETAHEPADLGVTETLFSVANGYLGMRGNPEEGRDAHAHGTFINGFHETWDIHHAEAAFGFARTGQTIVNVPDAKVLKLYVDDEPLILGTADLEHYERSLDLRDGVLRRSLIWRTPAGKRVQVDSTRTVSMVERHLALFTLEVTMLGGDAPVVVSSQLINRQDGEDEYHVSEHAMGSRGDPRKASRFPARVLLPRISYADALRTTLGFQCARSGMTLCVAADHAIETEDHHEVVHRAGDDLVKAVFRVDATRGRTLRLTKYVSYHTSRGVPPRELSDRCDRTLDRARSHGVAHYHRAQREWFDAFWRDADVEVAARVDGGGPGAAGMPARDGRVASPEALQQTVRYNIFNIAQASARADQQGVPAKGVTGSGYEGHYFWDAEVYVLPFLVYTQPEIARNLLHFRRRMLRAARQRAREMAHFGALFPWRTINGEEASAYYAAGTAQYHINADIIYALRKYVEITDDKALLFNEGAEMLVETARLWLDLGFYSKRQNGKFCLHGVTGPDEYNTVVNNNAYTNLMARENLWCAAQTVRYMRDNFPEHFQNLKHRTGLDSGEVEQWQKAGDSMYIPYDEELGINPQDDNFLDREVWDIEGTPRSRFPLLLYYHPLVIYRHQVIKQADVVLAMFLLGDEFSLAQKKRNFEYYDPLTTGDSSLSACIQSIIATEIGDMANALKYARYAVLMDLADAGGNVKDGCHIASMGGTWMVMVHGFGGMRDYGGQISFTPRLPAIMNRLRFRLTVGNQLLEVDVARKECTYLLKEGTELPILHMGKEVLVRRGESVTLPVRQPDSTE